MKRATFVFAAVCAASLIGCGKGGGEPSEKAVELGEKMEQHDKPFQTPGDTSPDSFVAFLETQPPDKQAEVLSEKAKEPVLRKYYKGVFQKYSNSPNANVAAAAKEGLAPAPPAGTK